MYDEHFDGHSDISMFSMTKSEMNSTWIQQGNGIDGNDVWGCVEFFIILLALCWLW
jgi:hypothetical protein